MARNGSGVYAPPATDYPAVASTLIESAKYNNVVSDIATAITGSIAADGQTTVTANLPMNSKKLTGLASGSARTDSSALGQVQDGTVNWVDGGGTADAITATYAPVITALIDGQICYVRATDANATTTPTFAPNGLTARTIVMQGGAALVAGSIGGDGHELILRYDLANTRWELLNPKPVEKASLAGATFTGPVNEARGSVAMHATTMDLWGQPNIIDGTGSAVTITAIANAPQAGARRVLYPIAGTIITNGATFAVDGAADYTTAAGDALEFEAITTNTYKVHITKKDGRAVGSSLVMGTPVATTSGTEVDYTGIPSWATLIIIEFSGVSLNGASNLLVQIGDAGGIETADYSSASISAVNVSATVGANFTTGFGIYQAGAANVVHGTMTLARLNSSTNKWTASHSLGYSNVAGALVGGGSKALTAALDRVRITTVNGTDAFDAGEVNIIYK